MLATRTSLPSLARPAAPRRAARARRACVAVRASSLDTNFFVNAIASTLAVAAPAAIAVLTAEDSDAELKRLQSVEGAAPFAAAALADAVTHSIPGERRIWGHRVDSRQRGVVAAATRRRAARVGGRHGGDAACGPGESRQRGRGAAAAPPPQLRGASGALATRRGQRGKERPGRRTVSARGDATAARALSSSRLALPILTLFSFPHPSGLNLLLPLAAEPAGAAAGVAYMMSLILSSPAVDPQTLAPKGTILDASRADDARGNVRVPLTRILPTALNVIDWSNSGSSGAGWKPGPDGLPKLPLNSVLIVVGVGALILEAASHAPVLSIFMPRVLQVAGWVAAAGYVLDQRK